MIKDEFISLRRLTPDDLNLLRDLELTEQLTMRNPWPAKALRECFDDEYTLCAVFVSEKLAGFSVIYNTSFTTDLLTIGIQPKFQGKGLGRRLLNFTLEQAKEQQVSEVFLEVRVSNVTAQNLYISAGFEKAGLRKGYYTGQNGEPGEDAITMRLELKPV